MEVSIHHCNPLLDQRYLARHYDKMSEILLVASVRRAPSMEVDGDLPEYLVRENSPESQKVPEISVPEENLRVPDPLKPTIAKQNSASSE